MNRLFVLRNQNAACLISVWALLFFFSLAALAETAAPPVNAHSPLSLRATHLLGLESVKSNCNGTLSIQDNALQFQQSGKPGAQVKVASIQAVFVDGESKQVGGVPMKLGKAAAPFGSGRLVSLFAHKKYDILTLEYVDGDGGVHGAIFQLAKGQGELVRDSLMARGVSRGSSEDKPTKQNSAEVINGNN